MQKGSIGVIAWARKRRCKYGFGLLGATGLLALALFLQQGPPAGCTQLDAYSRAQDTCVELEVVSTDAALQKGLSGRSHMPVNHGMLFDFGQEGYRCMWMKDMRFSLDMIWLDGNAQVIDVTTDVMPETYPEEKFCGQAPARYVIEVNAGIADEAGVSFGQQIQL